MRMDYGDRWHSFDDMPAGVEINAKRDGRHRPRRVRRNARSWPRGLQTADPPAGVFWTGRTPLAQRPQAVEARSSILYIGTDNGLVKIPEATVTR